MCINKCTKHCTYTRVFVTVTQQYNYLNLESKDIFPSQIKMRGIILQFIKHIHVLMNMP